MDFDKLIDDLVKLVDEFDPTAFIPKLDTLLGQVELLARTAVMLGPIVLLVLGLCYLLIPPKEANHSFGYRFYWGMSSVESWLFTQKVAGIAWILLGLGSIIYMGMVCNTFRSMELMEIVWEAVRCIFWELGLIAASCILIDLIVLVMYNRKGIRRKFRRDPNPTKQ